MSTHATEKAAKRETKIEADPNLPTIRIIRDFDAPPDRVFRAWVEPELVKQWLGPKSTEMRIDKWNAHTGGNYRYAALQDGEEVAAFYGSFHEVRPNERLVQTFTWEGMPDGVSLETMTFQDLETAEPEPSASRLWRTSRAGMRSWRAAWRSGSTKATRSWMRYSPRAERLQCVSVSGFHSCERRESRAAARSQAGAPLSWTSERADTSFVCEASEEGSGPKSANLSERSEQCTRSERRRSFLCE